MSLLSDFEDKKAAEALADASIRPLASSYDFSRLPLEDVAVGLASIRSQYASQEGVTDKQVAAFSGKISDFYQKSARQRGQDLSKVQLDLDPPESLDQDSLENYEQAQIDKLLAHPQGFLYEGQVRSQVQNMVTHQLRKQANEDPEDQGFFADLYDGSVDLSKRVGEGVATGVVGLYDRDGSKAAAVQRFISTNPENDGKFISDLATGAGSLVPSVGSAIIGGAIGSALGPEGTAAGAVMGAAAGSGGYSLLLRANEAYQTTFALTNSREKAEESWTGQIPAAAVDALSDMTIARFLKPIKGVRASSRLHQAAKELKLAKTPAEKLKIIKKYDTAYITAGLEGGVGEAIAEPLGDIMAAKGLDPDIREGQVEEAWDHAGRSAMLGFILGSAASSTLEGRQGALPMGQFMKEATKAGIPLDNIVDLETGVVKPAAELEKVLQEQIEREVPLDEGNERSAGEQRRQEINSPTHTDTTEKLEQRANEILDAPEAAPEGVEPVGVVPTPEVAPEAAPEATPELTPLETLKEQNRKEREELSDSDLDRLIAENTDLVNSAEDEDSRNTFSDVLKGYTDEKARREETAGPAQDQAPLQETPEARSDEQVVEDLSRTFAENPDPRVQKISKTIKLADPNNLSEEAKAAQKIGEFFGRQVVMVDGLSESGANGMFDPNNPEVLVINSKASRSETLVTFHELLHSLKTSSPELYSRLNDAVDADLDKYTSENKTRRQSLAEDTKEEFLADFLADRATSKEFWEKLAQEDRGVFDFLSKTLKDLIAKVKGKLGTERFVKDLEAADKALSEALIALRGEKKGGGGPAPKASKPAPKASKPAPKASKPAPKASKPAADTKFELAPTETEQDAAHAKAVESGDLDTAQKMVDAKAESRGHGLRGARSGAYYDDGKMPTPYGGGNAGSGYYAALGDFSESDLEKLRDYVNILKDPSGDHEKLTSRSENVAIRANPIYADEARIRYSEWLGEPLFNWLEYQTSLNDAEQFGKYTIGIKPMTLVDAKDGESRTTGRGVSKKTEAQMRKDFEAESKWVDHKARGETFESWSKRWHNAFYLDHPNVDLSYLLDLARKGLIPHNAIIRRAEEFQGRQESERVDEIVVASPSQIKSAEPATYDANGDLIPLSQRFDSSKDSIKFELQEPTADQVEEILPGATYVAPEEVADSDLDGPVVLGSFHGSTHTLLRFTDANGNLEGDWGGATYSSTEIEDVNANYAGEGPDLTMRIEGRADQVESDFDDMDLDEFREAYNLPDDYQVTEDSFTEIAKKSLVGDGGQVYPLLIPLENPAVIGGPNETRLEPLAVYDEEAMEDHRPVAEQEVREENDLEPDESLEGYEQDVRDKLEEYAHENGYYNDELHPLLEAINEVSYGFEDVSQDYNLGEMGPEGAGYTEVEKFLREEVFQGAFEPNTGEFAAGEAVRRVFEELGHDGIVDRNVNSKFGSNRQYGTGMQGMGPNTVHVIVPNDTKQRIRSAINPEIKFEMQQAEQMANPDEGIQTAGQNNAYRDKEGVTDYQQAEEIIADTTGFHWMSQPTDKAGQKDAENFLTSLMDPKVIKALQDDLSEAGYSDDRVEIATGLARASYFAYVVRVYQTDIKGASNLAAKGFILADDVKVLFFPKEGEDHVSVTASTIGATLRSFRTLGGGNVMTMLATELKGRGDTVAERYDDNLREFVESANRTLVDLDNTADEREVSKVADDALLAAQTEQTIAELKAHERKAIEAHKKVLKLVISVAKASGVKFELNLPDSIKAYEDAIDSGDLDLMSDALDGLMDSFSEEMTPRIKKAADTARKVQTRATKTREKATGTTSTKNQVDILGKRTIGVAERATNEVKKKTDALRDLYNELLDKELDQEAFIDEYVALGGTEEVAVDVYEANQKIKSVKAQKAAKASLAAKARKAAKGKEAAERRAERAEKNADKTIEGLFRKLDTKSEETGDKTKSLASTLSGMTKVDQTSTRAEIVQELADLKRADGKPALTPAQVQTAADTVLEVREGLKTAQEEKQEAKRLEKERLDAESATKADEGAAIRQIEALEQRVLDPKDPEKKPVGRRSMSQVFNEFVRQKEEVQKEDFVNALKLIKNSQGGQLFSDAQIEKAWTLLQPARDATAAKVAIRKEASRKVAEDNRARRLFEVKDKSDEEQKDKPRTVHQILMQEVINNPRRKISTHAERVALAEEILTERTNLSPNQVKKVALEVESKLDAILERKKQKALEPIMKQLTEGGNLTPAQINQAIRLQVADPTKDLVTSIAALSGWDGLSGLEVAKLADLEAKIEAVGQNTRTAMGYRYQQMRLIRSSTGLSPTTRRLLNSYIRGSMYSSTNSQFLGPMVGAWVVSSVVIRESFKMAFDPTLPLGDRIGAIIDLHKRSMGNLARGAREFRAVWKTGTAFNAATALAGGQEVETQGRVVVDDLTTFYDTEGRRLQNALKRYEGNPVKKNAARVRSILTRFVISAQRFTFLGLTSADAAATKTAASIQAGVLADRRARKAGLTRAEMNDMHEMYLNDSKGLDDYLIEQGVDDPNLRAIEIQDKLEGSVFQAYTDQITKHNQKTGDKIETVNTLLDEAVRDVQSQIGTGETNNTPIGWMTSAISGAVNKVPFGPLLVPAVRTVGNVTDELMWTVPIVGLVRAYNVKKHPKSKQKREAFRNLSSDWQFQKRVNLAMTSHVLTMVAAALLEANDELDDEDKWFWYTGFFPSKDKAEQERWKENGWTEHTLLIGNTRVRLDRGFGQSILFPAVIASTVQKSSRALRDVDEGKLTQDEAHDKIFADLTGYSDLVVPGWSSVRQFDDALDRREGLGRYLASRASVLAPFSGMLKTPRRVTERINTKQTDAAWHNFNPYYVNTDGEGVVIYRNSMFEPLENTSDAWEYVRKLGIPIYMEPTKRGRDPRRKDIMDLRIKHGVTAGSPMTRQEFSAMAADSDKPATNGAFNDFGEAVADEIAREYARVKKSWPADPTDKQVSQALSRLTRDAEAKVKRKQGYRDTSETKKRKRAEKKARKPLRT